MMSPVFPVFTPRPYFALLTAFVEQRVSADEFEAIYLSLFKGDATMSDTAYRPLNELFVAVDSYCADEDLRDLDDLGPNELREVATATLDQLHTLYRDT